MMFFQNIYANLITAKFFLPNTILHTTKHISCHHKDRCVCGGTQRFCGNICIIENPKSFLGGKWSFEIPKIQHHASQVLLRRGVVFADHNGMMSSTFIAAVAINTVAFANPYPARYTPSLAFQQLHSSLKLYPMTYNFVTNEYEKRVEPFTGSFVQELIQPFIEDNQRKKKITEIRDGIELSNSSLLDVGCGTGIVSLIAANEKSKFELSHITATDVSDSMIARLRERVMELDKVEETQGLRKIPRPIIETIVADGQCLPQTLHNRFDYAVAHFSVIFFPSPNQGLEQIRECLLPGGRMVMSAWGNAEETPAFQIFKDAFHIIGAADSYPAPPRISGSPETLKSLLEQADFINIEVVGPIPRILYVRSAQAYYDRFVLSNPKLQQTIATLEPTKRGQLHETVLELANSRGGGGNPKDGNTDNPNGAEAPAVDSNEVPIELVSMAYFAYGRKRI